MLEAIMQHRFVVSGLLIQPVSRLPAEVQHKKLRRPGTDSDARRCQVDMPEMPLDEPAPLRSEVISIASRAKHLWVASRAPAVVLNGPSG